MRGVAVTGLRASFYYADPDGNSVELQCDNFGGEWSQSAEFMRTAPEFAADPIGTHVDPEVLVVARRAGASSDDIIGGQTRASSRRIGRSTSAPRSRDGRSA